MKLKYFFTLSILIIFNHNAFAVTEYDQDITPDVIFGSGNSNGFFTTNRANGIELGLRAKIPSIGLLNSSGDGRYHFSLPDTDHDDNPATPNRWNFDWTINTDINGNNGSELDEYTYELGMDADPSEASNYLIFDPVSPSAEAPFYDHSIGNNGTANGAGTEATDEATYLSLLNTQNVLQQSWRYAFFPSFPLDNYNPNEPGIYNVYLAIKDLSGNEILRTEIKIIVGGAEFDDNVTPEVIFGSGNANGSFTTKRASGLELGLRAKIPFAANINSLGDGKYQYALSETDHDNNPGTANRWNFDWAINTDFDDSNNTKLNEYTYELGMDADPSAGTDYLIFDPVTPTTEFPFFDHSIGDNSTANGAGVEASDGAEYETLLSSGNVLQQSWRYAFFPQPPLGQYNPSSPGTYNIYLEIKDLTGETLIRNEIVVIIFDDNKPEDVTPEVIFGSGNVNGNFNINRTDGIELGLRAKIPFSGTTNYFGNGTYRYTLNETDHDNNPGTANRWNFDWTINTDYDNSNGSELNQYTYELGLDSDPGLGKNYLVFDPITPTVEVPFFDHSIGNNNTINGGGEEATSGEQYENLLAVGNVLQQSWRYAFFPNPPLDSYDPNVPGTYHVYLAIKDLQGNEIARNEIRVIITPDDNVTPDVIFGSGNVNGNFTIDRQEAVEVGLRAKIPFTGTTNYNGDGTYSYTLQETDHDNNPGTDNRWNFDWSINTDYNDNSAAVISDYTYELGLDSDPGVGTDFLIFDPVTPTAETPFFDHAFGDNTTANGDGTTGTSGNYQNLINNSNVAQNSWRYAFFPFSPLDNYNPNEPGNYIVYLAVKDGGEVIAKAQIQVLIEGATANNPPQATVDHYTTNEDQSIVVDAFSGVLINDFDPELSSLRVVDFGSYVADGIGGEITINSDGSFAYTPPADVNGLATLNYFITDGVFTEASQLTIAVDPVNDSPDFTTAGDVAFYNLTASNSLVVIGDFTNNYVFGPSDESNQNILGFDINILSDSDSILEDIVATNDGFLIIDYSGNYGTALVNISMKDNGGTDNGGVDTSSSQLFSVSNIDLIFANDFESQNGFALLDYINQINLIHTENQTVSLGLPSPVYEFNNNTINFLGYQLRLNNDYQSQFVILQLVSWINEVLKLEELPYKIE